MTKQWDICEEFNCDCRNSLHAHTAAQHFDRPGGGWTGPLTVTVTPPETEWILSGQATYGSDVTSDYSEAATLTLNRDTAGGISEKATIGRLKSATATYDPTSDNPAYVDLGVVALVAAHLGVHTD